MVMLYCSPNTKKLEYSRRRNEDINQTQYLELKNLNSVITFVLFVKKLKNSHNNKKKQSENKNPVGPKLSTFSYL